MMCLDGDENDKQIGQKGTTEYNIGYYWVGMGVNWELCKRLKFPLARKFYMHIFVKWLLLFQFTI